MSRPGVQHYSASTTSSVRGGEASKPLGEAEEMVQAAEVVAVRWETMGRVDIKAITDGLWAQRRFLIHQGMERRGGIESVGGDGRSVEREAEGWRHARYQETMEWKLKTEERKRKCGFR
jgi:hypothetical protein